MTAQTSKDESLARIVEVLAAAKHITEVAARGHSYYITENGRHPGSGGPWAELLNAVRALDRQGETGCSDELTVKFPRAWAPYLQAVILGAIGDFDGEGDCRWHLNELAKFLGNSALKASGEPS